MLANGCSADSIDEYCQLAETTVIENLKRFCKVIEAIYGAINLRKPNREDLKRFLHKIDKRGFPDMIGRFDCMHWEWKNSNHRSRLWLLTTHGFGMHSFALLDQTTISTFFGLLLCSMMLSIDGHQNGEDSDKDVNDDKSTHARAMAM
ncbi:hypothetical protein D8674_040062 [Pyrus ussuriensis x Pyrus communis]|uniref:Uncharacterized protein n=1 Tax=Pyrus ussuriensis x Pyrus communis TaxID=2448454 RepID=A0A5N5F7F8_9ROSA|nr:hypothetical protein D8674_039988 [Pyrus ussuriensis x Pyrus communis]KAB2612011.1 hypothetical protein D8674_040062 [Pyrus ussuriensis x Pyrus communis]